jgi:hypothetical protein
MSSDLVFSKSRRMSHYLILLILLVLAVLVLKLYQNWLNLFFVVLAYFAGVFILWLDEFRLYRLYREANNDGLATRSTIFLLSLPLLSIFVLTSTGSIFGVAMVMAMNSYLCLEMWTLYQEPILFKERFFASSVKLKMSQIQNFCVLATVYVVVMWLMWLWF